MPRPSTLLIVLMACTLAACRGEAPAEGTVRVIEDDLGRTVRVPQPLTRIATLAPSLTEVVFAAGAGHLLTAVGQPDDYPPAVDALPRYATFPLDYEALTTLAPGLVLATDQVNPLRDAETLEDLGMPVAFLSFGSLADVVEAVRQAGDWLGTSPAATAAADSLQAAIDSLQARTDAAAHRPSVLVLIGDDILYSFGRESYAHEVIALAGGESVMSHAEAIAPVLSEEFVITEDPDVIFGPWDTDYTAADLLALHPAWADVAAVREGRVFGIDPDLLLRPGPRLIEGARRIAARLHPALFPSAPAPAP